MHSCEVRQESIGNRKLWQNMAQVAFPWPLALWVPAPTSWLWFPRPDGLWFILLLQFGVAHHGLNKGDQLVPVCLRFSRFYNCKFLFWALPIPGQTGTIGHHPDCNPLKTMSGNLLGFFHWSGWPHISARLPVLCPLATESSCETVTYVLHT